MNEPVWLDRAAFERAHAKTLLRHGGLAGVRDTGLLESALARPQQIFAYDPECDLARLAAAYAFGRSRNHPYFDGNKRAGFLAMVLFLAANGAELTATDGEAIATMLALARGELSEGELAVWIRAHLAKFKPE